MAKEFAVDFDPEPFNYISGKLCPDKSLDGWKLLVDYNPTAVELEINETRYKNASLFPFIVSKGSWEQEELLKHIQALRSIGETVGPPLFGQRQAVNALINDQFQPSWRKHLILFPGTLWWFKGLVRMPGIYYYVDRWILCFVPLDRNPNFSDYFIIRQS